MKPTDADNFEKLQLHVTHLTRKVEAMAAELRAVSIELKDTKMKLYRTTEELRSVKIRLR